MAVAEGEVRTKKLGQKDLMHRGVDRRKRSILVEEHDKATGMSLTVTKVKTVTFKIG